MSSVGNVLSNIVGAGIRETVSNVQARLIQNLAGTSAGRALLGAGALRYASLGGEITKGYLLWDDGELVFPINPEAVVETLSPAWATHNVPGQQRPTYQFINGGERTVQFKLFFFYRDRDRATIRDQLNELKRLTNIRETDGPRFLNLAPRALRSSGGASFQSPAISLPIRRGTYFGPPVVQFHMGSYFQGETFIVKNVRIETKKLFDPYTLLPMYAEADITLAEVTTDQNRGENQVVVP